MRAETNAAIDGAARAGATEFVVRDSHGNKTNLLPSDVSPRALMVRGGAGLTPEVITQMARAWIFWDWFRMAGTPGSYLCFVKAATLQ